MRPSRAELCRGIPGLSLAMIKLLFGLAALLASRFKQRRELALEDLALCQQPASWKMSMAN